MNRTFVPVAIAALFIITACGPSTSERIAAANVRSPAHATAVKPAATTAYTSTHTTPATLPARYEANVTPRIVGRQSKLQCVPYARSLSGIPIRGDAWTWWPQAAGKYQRTHRPTVGSVIVFSKTRRNKYGHLAVVTQIVNDREIVARHANWLNKGRIHLDTPIRDVSPNNDWSAVRVWYTPGKVFGLNDYPVEGFIHPSRQASR